MSSTRRATSPVVRGASSASRTAARPRPRTPLSASEGAGAPGSHSRPTPRAGYITVGCQKDEVIADGRAGNAVGTSSIPRPSSATVVS